MVPTVSMATKKRIRLNLVILGHSSASLFFFSLFPHREKHEQKGYIKEERKPNLITGAYNY